MTVKVPDAVDSKYSSVTSSKGSLWRSAKMSVCSEDTERLRIYALTIAIVSVIFDVLLAVAAFVCAAITDSSAGYAFALDSVLDAVADALVLWRFYGQGSAYSDEKEQIATISLGILFCLAAVAVISKSVYDLVVRTIPQKLMYVFILAGVGGFVNAVLGIVKYLLGRKMSSQCLTLEAINTLLSAFLALMLAVSDGLYFYHPSAWSIDPITSIVVALILFAWGVRVIPHKKEKADECSPLLHTQKV